MNRVDSTEEVANKTRRAKLDSSRGASLWFGVVFAVAAVAVGCSDRVAESNSADAWMPTSDTVDRDVPSDVGERELRVRDVDLSSRHVCAVLEDRMIRCWGRAGVESEVSDAEVRRRHDRFTPDGAFRDVEAASGFACGLRVDDRVECWPHAGEFGRMEAGPPLERAKQFEMAGSLCAEKLSGDIQCWEPQARDDEFREVEKFTGEWRDFAAVSGGGCVLRDEQEEGPESPGPKLVARCRDSLRGDSAPPSAAHLPGIGFSQIEVGAHLCGIYERGDGAGIRCKGWHDWAHESRNHDRAHKGWLPNSAREGRYRDLEIVGSRKCAITAETGRIECWGRVIDGTFDMEYEIPSGTGYKALEFRIDMGCAIRDDNTLVCNGDWIPEPLK